MEPDSTDILVIGGSAAGCAAAIAAARMGASVIILEPTSSIGGTTTNGVHCFDTGTLQALSGITAEFIARVRRFYEAAGIDHPMLRSNSDLFWEFHVSESIWRQMIAEHPTIRLLNGAVPVGIEASGGSIRAVLWERAVDPLGSPPVEAQAPHRCSGKVVIDASYEGDVAAWAGAPFQLGREPRTPHEPHAGVIFTTTHERHVHQNGFLPSTILPGSTGEGDDRIMAFTCRLSLRYRRSGYEPHLLKSPPNGYDPYRYRWRRAAVSPEGDALFGTELIPSLNGKLLTNQRYFGDDRLAQNRDYILAHPRQRAAIRQSLYDHVLGFLYFIQTEGGTPELGLAEDEYTDNNGLPHAPYVREGRRFMGARVVSEADINPFLTGPGPRPPRIPTSIAIGDWAIESRRCSDEVSAETGTYNGSMFMRALRAPYQVPFETLLPQGVENLIVTTTISATHVAFSALRVEAVWTQTGTAAGVAAALAVRSRCEIADVDVGAVQHSMISMGCKLTYFSDVEVGHPHFVAIQRLALKGLVPEDKEFRFFPDRSATWGDLAAAAVLGLDIAISVTGIHFEGVDPGHPAFRHLETLYDVASRAGVLLFENMRFPHIDAPADHLRPEVRTRWLKVDVEGVVRRQEAVSFLSKIAAACGRPAASPSAPATETAPITRGELASIIMAFQK